MRESPQRERIIEPPRGLARPDLEELWHYRDLFFFFVWRDLKVRYKQTVLGFTWALVPPLASMVVFSVVFGRLAEVSSDGAPYPIFAYMGVLPWTYFANSVQSSATSLVGNRLLTKVYFPRLLVPLTPTLVNLVDFGLAASMLIFLLWLYGFPLGAHLLLALPLVVVMVAASFGVGLWLAGLAVQYRDVKYGVGFLLQLLMYAAPVVWPASAIESAFLRVLYGLHPMAGVIEGLRSILLETGPFPWDLVLPGVATSAALVVSGVLYYSSKERIFADVF